MTELLVGTKKGLFVLEGEPGAGFEVTARAFAGEPVEYALRDPRSGRLLAAVTRPFYGPKVFFTDDPAGEWEQAEGVALPEGGEQALERIWGSSLGEADGTIYAGGDPGVLFESRDGGATFELNRALWEHPTRPKWQPGGGGLCLHSIETWPGEPDRLAIAISAAGVWLTDDGGESWRKGNQGMRAALPAGGHAGGRDRRCASTACAAHPRQPERIFMQFHGGVYRSDDAGESWTDIAPGLPSDFGFPLAIDPADPDSAYVIPLVADMDRVTPEGRVRVYETRDAGASWTPRGDGLPQPTRLPDDPARGVRAHAARATRSSSTSARPRATCSAPATRARAGSSVAATCRRSTRSPRLRWQWQARRRAPPRPGTRSSATSTCAPTRPTSARARPRRRRSRRRGSRPAPRAASCSTCRAGSAATRCRSPRAGYRVTGVDRSAALLDEARRRAGGERWPKFVAADYRELPFADDELRRRDEPVQLARLPRRRGGHAGAGRDPARPAARAARLVVELMHRDRLVRGFAEQDWRLLGEGRLLLEQRTFDAAAGVAQTTQTLIDGAGERESRTFSVRVYTRDRAAGDARPRRLRGGPLPTATSTASPFGVDTRLVAVAVSP